MEGFFAVLAIIWSILCLILFFKIWHMTNDVSIIKELLHNNVMILNNIEKSHKTSVVNGINIGDRLKVKETGEYVVVSAIDNIGSNTIYECTTSDGKKDFYNDELIKE